MANQQHLDILKQGSETWNRWRQEHPEIQPDLRTAHLEGTTLSGTHLEKANLSGAHLEKATLSGTQLEGANLSGAHLQGANLRDAYLAEANLNYTQLEGANLSGAHLQGANLRDAYLAGANLQLAFFDNTTRIDGLTLGDETHGFVSLVDVNWGGVNLAVVNWTSVRMLGDEDKAHQSKWIEDYRVAVRANRQLAVVLREQGLSEEADGFAYRAQILQRIVWRKQRKPLKYLFSWFLYLLAGYGYRPLRSLIAYVVLIVGFAVAYYTIDYVDHLTWYGALVVSLSAFHGRGFVSQQSQPGTPETIIAAAEAVMGLLIEISFIATFTQRFFGK